MGVKHLSAATAALGISVLTLGCGSHAYHGVVSPTVSPALDPLADQLAHAALPDGQRVGPALTGVAYGPDQATDWTVQLQATACYAFGYAADADAVRFAVRLFEPSGRQVAIARARTGPGVLTYCAPVTGAFRLQGKVLVGAGHYLVVPYGKPGSAGVAPGAVVTVVAAAGTPAGGAPVGVAVAAPAVLDIPTAIDKQATVAAVGAARLGDFFTGAGDQSDWAAQLTTGTCYWFIGAGDAAKIHGLTLSLWDPHGAPLAQGRSDSQVATLAYCARETGAYRFEAKVNGGNAAKGDFKVAVYAK